MTPSADLPALDEKHEAIIAYLQRSGDYYREQGQIQEAVMVLGIRAYIERLYSQASNRRPPPPIVGEGSALASGFVTIGDFGKTQFPAPLPLQNATSGEPRGKANTNPLVGELLEALRNVTEHFSAVMAGPFIAGKGVVFANGVAGIPTIKAACAAISRAEREMKEGGALP